MKKCIAAFLLFITASAWAALNTAASATTGQASWYGKREQGKRMANGKKFDRMQFTCASRAYPLGTRLMVRFPKKGTFVAVTVTDRGPYRHPKRVIDLSERAAAALGLKPYGIATVMISPLHIFVNTWRTVLLPIAKARGIRTAKN